MREALGRLIRVRARVRVMATATGRVRVRVRVWARTLKKGRGISALHSSRTLELPFSVHLGSRGQRGPHEVQLSEAAPLARAPREPPGKGPAVRVRVRVRCVSYCLRQQGAAAAL